MRERKPGKWTHSKVFEDVEVAHDEGVGISTFWNLSENDRAYMIARRRAKGTMEAWEMYLQEERAKAESRKSKPKPKAAGKS